MSRALLSLFAVVFVDLLGFGIVIPILPYYASHFGASAFELGWLMTSYSLMQMLFSPLWGGLSDRFGRKPIFLMSILATALSLLYLASAQTLTQVFIGRTLAGVFAANISMAYTMAADLSSEKDRPKAMGLVGAGFGLGFIFGPALGGFLSQSGQSLPFHFSAGLSFLNLGLAWLFLKEPSKTKAEREAQRTRKFSAALWKKAFESKTTRVAILTFFFLTLVVTQMEVTFALFLSSKFGSGARTAGGILAIMGVIMAIMQGGGIGPLSKRVSEWQIVSLGLLICSVALVCFGISPVLSGVIGSLVLLALGHGALHPTLSSLVSKASNPADRGKVMGVFQSAGSLSRVIGPPIAGYLFDHAGQSSPYYVGAAVLFATAAILRYSGIRTS